MNNIKQYEDFLVESKISEAKGIHPAIKEILSDFLKENPKATFDEAKAEVRKKRPGWKLSTEDFGEAQKMI
jgi:hypothetical protein